MALMTHEYSRFPNEYYKPNDFKDLDNTVGAIVNNIKNQQAFGNYEEAKKIIEREKNTIKKYMLTTETINAIEEELRNLEIYAVQLKSPFYYQTEEPETEFYGDVWIG